MISFRYHLVSIVGVFLALALGIVIGTTALNGPITKDLRNQVNDVKAQRDGLATQVKTLQSQVDDAGQFATTYGAQLVSGSLPGTSVVVVSLPGTTPGMQDGVTQQIAAAGGKITGRLTITSGYLDPSRGTEINALATGPVHPLGWVAPETSDAARLGGSLLAYVLLGKGQATDVQQVISAFAERHLVSVEGSAITPSTAVVVLGRGKLNPDAYASDAQLQLVDALAGAGGKVVVAGDPSSATGGGVIASVRQQATTGSDVSTVDNANSAFGQVSSTLALAATINGQAGNYGTGEGADALFPAPAR